MKRKNNKTIIIKTGTLFKFENLFSEKNNPIKINTDTKKNIHRILENPKK